MPLIQTLTSYQLAAGGRIYSPGAVVSLTATDYAALVGADKGTKWTDYAGSFDQIASMAALPTAGSAYRGEIVYNPGDGTTTADALYVCLRSATGTYAWKSIATG